MSGFTFSFPTNNDSWVEYDTPLQSPAVNSDARAVLADSGELYAQIEGSTADSVKQQMADNSEEGATMSSCIVNLANTILGAGMLGLPHAFAECGWALGYGMLALSATLSTLGLLLLSRSESHFYF